MMNYNLLRRIIMKKVIAVFLSVFMLVGIAGCSSKEKSPEEVVTITLDA